MKKTVGIITALALAFLLGAFLTFFSAHLYNNEVGRHVQGLDVDQYMPEFRVVELEAPDGTPYFHIEFRMPKSDKWILDDTVFGTRDDAEKTARRVELVLRDELHHNPNKQVSPERLTEKGNHEQD